MKTIVIDTLGADNSSKELILGAIEAKRTNPSYRFAIAGDKKEITKLVLENGFQENNFDYIDSSLAFTNSDSPKELIKKENKTSLALSLDYLKSNEEAIGIICSGSTGGLLVGSIFRLGLLEGIKIPLLAAIIKSFSGKTFVLLDCGANLDFDTNMFLKAAKMGSSLISSHEGISSPRVALLNVGKEKGKGNSKLNDAYIALEEDASINFIGNIEGNDIFANKCDVLVTEGYAGNVVLKLAESFGLYTSEILEPLDKKLAKDIYKNFAYSDEGASILLGPKKICLKCHGSATRKSIVSTVSEMIELDEGHLIDNLKETLKK